MRAHMGDDNLAADLRFATAPDMANKRVTLQRRCPMGVIVYSVPQSNSKVAGRLIASGYIDPFTAMMFLESDR